MTYYDELGVSPTATTEEIKRAYRQISKLYHPDLQTDENVRQVAEIQQRRLNSIVATLTNPDERANYDQSLRGGGGEPLQPRFTPGGLDAFVPPPAPSGFSSGRRQRFVWGGLFALPILGSALFWWFTERNIVGVPVNTATTTTTAPTEVKPPEQPTTPVPEPPKPVDTAATNSVPLPVPFPLPAPPGAAPPAEKPAETKKVTPTEKAEKKAAEADKKKQAAAEPPASEKPPQTREQSSKIAASPASANKGAEAKNNAPATLPPPPINKSAGAGAPPVQTTVAHAALPATPPPASTAAAPAIAPPPAVATSLPNAPHLSNTLPATAPAPAVETAAAAVLPSGKPPATGVVAGLNGMWIYVPMTKDKANNHGIYPPEYIELALQQNRGHLQGIYRSRYRISDRPVTPEVNFQFQGNEAGAQQYGWKLSDGTRGQVRLQQLSATTIQVDWYVTQFGRSPGLASGSAVLTRRP